MVAAAAAAACFERDSLTRAGGRTTDREVLREKIQLLSEPEGRAQGGGGCEHQSEVLREKI